MNDTFVASSWIKITWLLSGKRSKLPRPRIDDDAWETLEKFLYSFSFFDTPVYTVAWYKYANIAQKHLELEDGLKCHLHTLGFDSPATDLWGIIKAYQKYMLPLANEIYNIRPSSASMNYYLENSNKIIFDLFSLKEDDQRYWDCLKLYGELLRKTKVLIIPDVGMKSILDRVPIAQTLGYLYNYDQIIKERKALAKRTAHYGEVLLPPMVTIYLDQLDKVYSPAEALLRMRNEFRSHRKRLRSLHQRYYSTDTTPKERSYLENKLCAERMEIIRKFNLSPEDSVKARELRMIEYAEGIIGKFGLVKLGRDALNKLGISRYLSPYHSIVRRSNKYYDEDLALAKLGWL